MLSGKARLKGCHSSNISQARLRFASTFFKSLPSTVSRNQPETRAGLNVIEGYHSSSFRRDILSHVGSHFLHAAYMSASSRSSTKRGNQESKFLKPRGKPTFRERTKEEHEEFMKVLQETEKQHGLQLAHRQSRNRHSKQSGRQAEFKTVGVTGDALVSPFFAVPDFALPEHEQQLEHRSKTRSTPKTLPKRTRLSRYQASTTALEQELFYLAHNDPNPIAIQSILKILIHNRKIKPTSQHYEALILANTWPEYGSVSNIEEILLELEVEGMEIGANIITAVLKVLAVHPSLELSHRMLSMAERRWLQLPPQTFHYLVLAMIRTQQIELAAWTLDILRSRSKPVRSYNREVLPDYLVVLLLAKMVEIGDWEGILRYTYKLRDRRAADREIPTKFWGWLLEHASKTAREVAELQLQNSDISIQASMEEQQNCTSKQSASHDNGKSNKTPLPSTRTSQSLTAYQQTQLALSNPAHHLTTYIWKYYVTSMSIRPSHTTLLNILHLASSTGEPWLAHSVVAVMMYVDGIDDLGRPIAKIGPEISALVDRAIVKQREVLKSQGRDLEKEKEEEDRAERERKSIRDEDEAWWMGFLGQLKDEEMKRKQESGAGGGAKGQSTRETDAIVGSVSPSSIHFDEDSTRTQPSSHPARASTPVSTPGERPEGLNVTFDKTKVPPGNLWPLFPSIGGLNSAHVDPWDALGPRSSVRRKWTEAQEHFKRIEKASKKRY